jgi:gluconolactonase
MIDKIYGGIVESISRVWYSGSLPFFYPTFPLMKLSHIVIAACSMLAFKPILQMQKNLPAKPGSLKLISNQFSFTEGPAVDKQGNIYFTDQPNDKIWLFDTDGKLSVYMDKTGRSNGLYFDNDGSLLACADEKNELWRIDSKKKVTVLVSDLEGKKLNGPNDLWVHPDGSIYFTDPLYPRSYWQHKTSELKGEYVYRLAKGSKQPVAVATDLVKPNGIVGTPDGKRLYVADIEGNKTYCYTIGTKGELLNKKLFTEQGSDGMTLDENGNIYLTGNGVTVYDKDGKKIQHIDVPSNWTGNVCFGGKDRKTLLITASESVYTMEMDVKGVE